MIPVYTYIRKLPDDPRLPVTCFVGGNPSEFICYPKKAPYWPDMLPGCHLHVCVQSRLNSSHRADPLTLQ